jgi:hypothetical protein
MTLNWKFPNARWRREIFLETTPPIRYHLIIRDQHIEWRNQVSFVYYDIIQDNPSTLAILANYTSPFARSQNTKPRVEILNFS